MTDTAVRPIGARITRKEDARFLTGAGQYTDDVTLANQSYAYFLRSPLAHARIKSIKTDKAKAVARSARASLPAPTCPPLSAACPAAGSSPAPTASR